MKKNGISLLFLLIFVFQAWAADNSQDTDAKSDQIKVRAVEFLISNGSLVSRHLPTRLKPIFWVVGTGLVKIGDDLYEEHKQHCFTPKSIPYRYPVVRMPSLNLLSRDMYDRVFKQHCIQQPSIARTLTTQLGNGSSLFEKRKKSKSSNKRLTFVYGLPGEKIHIPVVIISGDKGTSLGEDAYLIGGNLSIQRVPQQSKMTKHKKTDMPLFGLLLTRSREFPEFANEPLQLIQAPVGTSLKPF